MSEQTALIDDPAMTPDERKRALARARQQKRRETIKADVHTLTEQRNAARERMAAVRNTPENVAAREAAAIARAEKLSAQKDATLAGKLLKAKNARAAVQTTFVALDGEGAWPDPDVPRQEYVLIAASTGDTLYNPKGLATDAILDWLFTVKANAPPRSRFVGFFFTYDINRMLVDLPHPVLEKLWKETKAVYAVTDGDHHITALYYLTWIPTKFFVVTRRVRKTFTDAYGMEQTEWSSPSSVRIEDAGGFFQCSFVRALDDWQIGTEDERAFIATYKDQRGHFDIADIDNITRYNALECTLLAALMVRLDETLRAAGLTLRNWHGAACIAAAMFREHNITRHKEVTPDHAHDAIMRAYFGGRVQAVRLGIFPHAYQYDVRSCYPSGMVELPSLIGHWRHVTKYDPDAPYALWRVAFNVSQDAAITPFPVRLKDTRIIWPYQGEGWYWQPEVTAARKHCPPHLEDKRPIRIKEGWVFTPDNPRTRPFGYIRDMYEKRAVYKAAGDPRDKVLKLGMNSSYGKLAQGIGYDGKPPPFQSFVWAGMITSIARAKLYDAAMHDPDAVLSFATDGIITTRPLPLDIGDGLGQWETDEATDLIILRAGLLNATDSKNREKMRTRGYKALEVDAARWQEIRALWRKDTYNLKYRLTVNRFIGLGTALARNRWDLWGRFVEFPAVLTVMPDRSNFRDEPNDTYVIDPVSALHDFNQPLSAPYLPKDGGFSVMPKADDTENDIAMRNSGLLDMLTDAEQPDWT